MLAGAWYIALAHNSGTGAKPGCGKAEARTWAAVLELLLAAHVATHSRPVSMIAACHVAAKCKRRLAAAAASQQLAPRNAVYSRQFCKSCEQHATAVSHAGTEPAFCDLLHQRVPVPADCARKDTSDAVQGASKRACSGLLAIATGSVTPSRPNDFEMPDKHAFSSVLDEG